jgi:hypothetical protein
MSSDIMSRVIDVSKFDLIYAGAQKNIGPAGLTVVIVKDEILGKSGRKIPSMLDYKVHIDNGSMYNTPPVFSIYVAMLNLRWLKSKGGVAEIEKENKQKENAVFLGSPHCPGPSGNCRGAASMKLQHNTQHHHTVTVAHCVSASLTKRPTCEVSFSPGGPSKIIVGDGFRCYEYS